MDRGRGRDRLPQRPGRAFRKAGRHLEGSRLSGPSASAPSRRIEVLYWLGRSRRNFIHQNPRHDVRSYGTFALRSPVRPNPIGTAMVRLVSREGPVLRVRGLDCLDGTPLLDIKSDRCACSPKAPPKGADATVVE